MKCRVLTAALRSFSQYLQKKKRRKQGKKVLVDATRLWRHVAHLVVVAGASLGFLQDGCKMPSKSHKFPKVSLDFQSLVQIIPLRTGALHPLQISAGANAPAAPVLTRPLISIALEV